MAKETEAERLVRKKREKSDRAKERYAIIKAEKERLKAEGRTETSKETKQRMRKQAQTKARLKQKQEREKAVMLGANEITERTALGIPPDRKFTKANKLTLAAMDRVAQLGFDPLKQSVRIAQGKAFREDHPFLLRFDMVLTDWIDTLSSFDELDLMTVEKFKHEGHKALMDSFTPIDIRSKHTMELMTYIYPKRKAMEMSVNQDVPAMTVSPLTDEEIEQFNAKYKERY